MKQPTNFNLVAAAEIAGFVEQDCLDGELETARKNTLWLMDRLFPSGFVYTVNQGSSEPVSELPQ